MSGPLPDDLPQSDIPTTPAGHEGPTKKREHALIGKRLGNYEVLEEVGQGGMGIVYRARDRDLDRDVALKVLQPHLASDPEFEQRFVREAKMSAKLDHPNIVQVYSAGREGEYLFIAMQFVSGRTVSEIIKEEGRLPVDRALGIIRKSAEALDAAHKGGLVHRDIKPGNIMIDDQGRVKIMDFGLMRSRHSTEAITQTGVYYGTPEYSSPEQCETREVDGRSDIFSLGVVLYEMLAGRIPHVAETPLALFKKITEEPHATLEDIPRDVHHFLDRMMAKKVDDRYATAADVAQDAARLLAGGRVRSHRKTARVGRGKTSRSGLAVLVGGLVVVAVIIGFILSGGTPDPVVDPKPKADKLKVVVFDFPSGIPNKDTAWYEIAISDLLIASLGEQEFLNVPSRDKLLWVLRKLSLGDKVDDANRQLLVQELGAHAYVVGKFYAREGRVDITLHAYRLPDNQRLFTRKYKGEDLFELVDEISVALAGDLKGVAEGVVTSTPAVSSAPSSMNLAMENLEEPTYGAPAKKAAEMEKAPKDAKPSPKPVPGAKLETLRKEKDKEDAKGRLQGKRNRKFNAYSDRERVQQWYSNRQKVEKGGFEKKEFDEMIGVLRDEINSDRANLPAELDEYQSRVLELKTQLKEVAKQQGLRLTFICPCAPKREHRHFGRCAGCGNFLVVKVEKKK